MLLLSFMSYLLKLSHHIWPHWIRLNQLDQMAYLPVSVRKRVLKLLNLCIEFLQTGIIPKEWNCYSHITPVHIRGSFDDPHQGAYQHGKSTTCRHSVSCTGLNYFLSGQWWLSMCCIYLRKAYDSQGPKALPWWIPLH